MRINQLTKAQRILEGKLLAQKMRLFGVTADELAKEMEVNQGMVSKWRTGRKPINAERLMWLAGRFDFDPFEVRPGLAIFAGSSGSTAEQRELILKLNRFFVSAGPAEVAKLSRFLEIFQVAQPDRQGKL